MSFEHCPGLAVRGLRFFGTELSATGGDFRDLTFEWPLRLNLGKSNLSRSTIRYLGKVGAKGVDSSGSGVAFDGFQGKGEPFAGCSLTDTLIEKSWAAVDFWDCKPAIVMRNTVRCSRSFLRSQRMHTREKERQPPQLMPKHRMGDASEPFKWRVRREVRRALM